MALTHKHNTKLKNGFSSIAWRKTRKGKRRRITKLTRSSSSWTSCSFSMAITNSVSSSEPSSSSTFAFLPLSIMASSSYTNSNRKEKPTKNRKHPLASYTAHSKAVKPPITPKH